MLDYVQIVRYIININNVRNARNSEDNHMVSEKVKELEQENTILKEQVKALQGICGCGVELPKNCEYCQNFIQHYVRHGDQYIPIYNGSCAAGQRLRKKKVEETCKSFLRRQYGKNII